MSVKKRIFVTGAAGFIGSHLTEALLKRGDEVIGMDNFDPFYPEKIKRRNIKNIVSNPGFKFYEASILDIEKLKKYFRIIKSRMW